MIDALFYVSDKDKFNGPIEAEYVPRLEKAAADALALGVSQAFLDNAIRPHLPQPARKPTPSQILQPTYPHLTCAL